MYAVIKVGGKQERVAPGDVIEVEFMKVDPGSSVEFEPVLIVDDDGKAHHGKGLSKARVTAKLLGDKKGDKVRVFKYRPKSGYRRTQGHRHKDARPEDRGEEDGGQEARRGEEDDHQEDHGEADHQPQEGDLRLVSWGLMAHKKG